MIRNLTRSVVVEPDRYLGTPIRFDLEAFFEFQFWLAEQLEDLAQQYQPGDRPPAKVRGGKRPYLDRPNENSAPIRLLKDCGSWQNRGPSEIG